MPSFYDSKDLSAEERSDHVKRFLSAYGGKHGIRFEFSGSPRTDGKTVWLGELNASDETFIPRALAHGMHEMLHVTDTDIGEFQKGAVNALAASILNVLEDVRIDSIGMQRYPGYRIWRAELSEQLESEGKLCAALDPTQFSIDSLLAIWIHAELMSKLDVAWAQRCHIRLRNSLLEKLPAVLLHDILQAASRICSARSTKDTRLITEKILSLIMRTDAKKEGTGDLFSAQTTTEPHKLDNLLRLQNEAVKRSQHSLCPAPETAPRPNSSTPEFAQTVLVWPDNTTDKQLLEDQRLYSEKFRNETASLKRLTKEFQRILKCKTPAPVNAKKGHALAPDFVTRLGAKDERIFLRQGIETKPNADILVLLDRSGSMGVDRMTKAKVAVSALISALSSIKGVETSCVVFPGPNKAPLSVVKTRRDNERTFFERFSGIGAFGATPLKEALVWAIRELKNSKRTKRFAIVITDGSCRVENAESLRNAFHAAHIEVAVLNIDTDNPPLAQNTVNVKETKEIAAGLIKLLKATSFARDLGR